MPISSGSWRFTTANDWKSTDVLSLRQKSLRRFSYTLKVVLALKRQRNSVTYIRLIRLMDSVYGWNVVAWNLNRHTTKYSVITRLRFTDCLIISNCLSYPTVLILAILPIIQIVGISSHSIGQMLPIIRSMNWISLPYSSWKNVRLAKS